MIIILQPLIGSIGAISEINYMKKTTMNGQEDIHQNSMKRLGSIHRMNVIGNIKNRCKEECHLTTEAVCLCTKEMDSINLSKETSMTNNTLTNSIKMTLKALLLL